MKNTIVLCGLLVFFAGNLSAVPGKNDRDSSGQQKKKHARKKRRTRKKKKTSTRKNLVPLVVDMRREDVRPENERADENRPLGEEPEENVASSSGRSTESRTHPVYPSPGGAAMYEAMRYGTGDYPGGNVYEGEAGSSEPRASAVRPSNHGNSFRWAIKDMNEEPPDIPSGHVRDYQRDACSS